MKKYLAVGLFSLIASAGAFATVVCDNSPSGATPTITPVAIGQFVVAGFTPKCSNNVALDGQDNGTFYTVGGGSKKGKNAFMGSSAGGGVVPATSVTCSPTAGCSTANATSAANFATANLRS